MTTGVAPFDHVKGAVIQSMRRVWFVFLGHIAKEMGPVEVNFHNGSTILLDAAADGEALLVATQPWSNPFQPPLSDENARFVEKCGKWSAFDVSSCPFYQRLIGAVVDDFEWQLTPSGRIKGVTLRAGEASLRVEVEADEVYVDAT